MRATTILTADSEMSIGKLLRYGLGGYGYQVITTTSGRELAAIAAHKKPDLILLDTDLDTPLQGLEICQSLREWCIAPIFFLSDRRDKNTKIVALNVGADDYITKPFDMGELEARIRAVLRRVTIKETEIPTAEIRIDGLVIDLTRRRVFLHDQELHFTPTEYSILCLLAVNAGKVLTYNDLLAEIRKEQQTRPDHYLRVYINLIRRKLGESVDRPRYIFTEMGVGYRFVDISNECWRSETEASAI